jgi:Carboxypeptidase regulatory-like domain
MKLGSLLLALFLNTAPLLAQQPGTVSGKVVNSVTGQPVKKAVVTLRTATGQNSYVTGSDQSGKFLFDNVQPASYIATAQAEGYSDNMRNPGKPIAVAAQQQVQDVEVRIPPLSAISGRVLDEDGQPMAEVSVSASRYVYTALGKRFQMSASAQTNDRGEYRIFDIQPGRYYLMAVTVRNGAQIAQGENVHSTVPEEAYAPAYYPGVAELSQASLQEVQPGVEWSGADFKLKQLPAYHIRGHVTGATGRGGRGSPVVARRCEQDDVAASAMPVALRISPLPNGRFDASGAVSGTYCLSVSQAGPSGAGGVAAKQTVTVKAADIDDIELTAAPSFNISGAVTIDGTPPTPMPQINVGLLSISSQGAVRSLVKSDGSFQLENIYPGAYSLLMPQQGLLYIKSILYGSQDVTSGLIPSLQPGTLLNITMGTDPGEIDGTVQPGNVESGMPVLVAAIPEAAYAARQDMQRLTSTAAGGSLTLSNMAPGNYKVFALQTEDFSDIYNRELMKLLEGNAASVTVHAAGHEQISVTAISLSEVEQARGKLK